MHLSPLEVKIVPSFLLCFAELQKFTILKHTHSPFQTSENVALGIVWGEITLTS